jgi:hypothetical protein
MLGQNNHSGASRRPEETYLKFTEQGIKWQQVIAVAMIAVPWFLRDELAGRMEQRATDARPVLTAGL